MATAIEVFKPLLSKAVIRLLSRLFFYGASLVVAFTLPKIIGVQNFWSAVGIIESKALMVSEQAYFYIEHGATWLFGFFFFELGLFFINKIKD